MKKNLLLSKSIIVAVLLLMGVSAKAATTITVGATGASFTTIVAAYASISDATGGYIIELQSDYNPAGETYPIVLGAVTNANSATNSIIIQPKAGNTTVFNFSAALDATAVSTPNVNTAVRNYTATLSATTGLSPNTTYAITSTATNLNPGTFFTTPGTVATGITLSTWGLATASTQAAVITIPKPIFDLNGAQWVTIDGLDATKFLVENTAAATSPSMCVRITNDASNNTVKNITAKSNCQKGYGAMTIVTGVTNTTGNDNNTISNCSITNGTNNGYNCAINVTDAKATDVTITNNNIANPASTAGVPPISAVYIANIDPSAGTANVSSNTIYWTTSTALGNVLNGIYTMMARAKIESNYIGYATSAHTGYAELSGQFALNAIYMFNTNMIYPIQYNTIANINHGGTAFNGFYLNGGANLANLNANTIENITLNNTTGAATLYGIYNVLTLGVAKEMKDNIIRNCTASSSTLAATIAGIIQATTSYFASYTGNKVYGLTAGNSSSTAANNASGIRLYANNGAAANTITIDRNLIYDLKTVSDPANNLSIVIGISSNSGHATFANTVIVKNNMITLGNGLSLDHAIYGIQQSGYLAGNINYYHHNSVYIGGAVTGTPTKSTYAFYSAGGTASTTNEVKNNIFANQRTGTATPVDHYAIGYATASMPKVCDNNLYWANTLGYAVTTVKTDLTAWKDAVVAGSDAASFSSDPKFIESTSATPNLHINTAMLSDADNNGVFLATVTNDFDNDTRLGTNSKADIGADEYTYVADIIAPTVVSSAASSPTNAATIAVTITFSEAVTGFVETDLALTNCTSANFVAVSPTVYTVDITAGGQGSFSVTVPVSVANDISANANANTASNTLTYVYGTTGLALSSIANNIYAVKNNIVVKGISLGSSISIFTVTGQLVKTIKANADKSTIAVEKGVYIVKTVNQISKVIVN
jgi:hypothetical protein